MRFAHSVADSSRQIALPIIPELFDPLLLDKLLPRHPPSPSAVAIEPAKTNAMMSALRTHANRTFTQNNAPAYKSTSSPALDAFAQLCPWSNGTELESLLENAWSEDPELSLRIIWNLRSRLGLPSFTSFSPSRLPGFRSPRDRVARTCILERARDPESRQEPSNPLLSCTLHRCCPPLRGATRPGPASLAPAGFDARRPRADDALEKAQSCSEVGSNSLRCSRSSVMHLHRHRAPPPPLSPHLRLRLSLSFPAFLRSRFLIQGPDGSPPFISPTPRPHPLRIVTHISGSFMSAHRWSSIKYTRVPSVCMKNSSESFNRHDADRFKECLTSMEEKKSTTTGLTLLPYELVRRDIKLQSSAMGAKRAFGCDRSSRPESLSELALVAASCRQGSMRNASFWPVSIGLAEYLPRDLRRLWVHGSPGQLPWFADKFQEVGFPYRPRRLPLSRYIPTRQAPV